MTTATAPQVRGQGAVTPEAGAKRPAPPDWTDTDARQFHDIEAEIIEGLGAVITDQSGKMTRPRPEAA